MMNNDKGVTTNDSIGELVRIVDNHLNPMNTTSNLSWTRTYTPPLMGTSARAVKRRVDGDTGPIRIEGTDTYNRPLQHHYQNVRQILEQPQQSSQISNVDQSNYSRSLSNTKRDFFDKQSQLPISTYDYPPHESQQQQQPMQKIVTTITTTTETLPTLVKQTPLLTNHILEQSTETNIKTIKNDSQQPQIIERTEKYQEFSDSTNDGIRRLPMFPITKTTGATDLDQVQAQVNRLSDDHQAIQQLARELQEHNVTTTNQYKRLASQTNTTLTDTTTTTTTNPSNTIITDKTNKTVTSEFTVIDALLDNPLGSNDDKQNSLLHKRFNDILSNIRNSEYVNLFKNSTAKKILKTPTNEPVNTRLIRKQTHFTESNIEQISMSTEQTPLLNSKEKKKQDKVNKKKSKTKTKSKKLPKNVDYQVIDAIINSPISLYIPDSYLAKYKVTSRLSQLSSVPSIRSTDNSISMSQQLDTKANNETVYNLANVIHEIFLHHAAALTLLGSTPKKQLQNPMKPSVINELVYKQQPQQSLMNSNQSEIQLQPDPNKTRVLYRYLDEHGNVLKLSSTPPSQLRESLAEPSQQSSYRRTEPTYIYNQQITRNDEQNLRRIPEHEQRITRQVESRLPTTKTITKEDLELRNKQTSQLNNYSPRLDQITLEPLAQFSYRNIEPTYISNRQITKDDEQNLRRVPEHEQRITKQDELRWPTAIITTSTTKEDLELRNKNVSKLNIQPSPTVYNIPITIEHPHTIKTPPQQQRKHHHPNQQNVSLSWLPLSYQLEQQYVPIGSINYDTDSSMSEHSPIHQPYDYVPVYTHHHHNRGTFLPNACCHNHLQGHAHYPSPPPVSYVTSCIIPEYSSGSYSRNYIEVFRDGETIPSEVYSLPINELITTNNSHTSYDQHENKHQPSSSINLQFEKNIPSTSTHDQYHSRTIDTSPNRDNIYFDNYLPQSKSFDYRPLRTKIQREHKITPRLLVEEWDNPQQSSSTNYNQQMSTSSTDEVFINNKPTNKTSP
ncbi:unnamed protein product [Rotaria sp. Silwood1]|nr:unnamed protein product [Rotaria sp. Silwood1]CAF0763889.1 unnamed protein product [Rotaria sp. Silwood1]CAF3346498.1 unnamed protein product [Rotaria sp. Silwood1]CAF3350828.1 unnamed protein product [Rotaria sp. Silwood1]CAF4494552.1 unnamed protein product [Rotaria sp. Silwood1]